MDKPNVLLKPKQGIKVDVSNKYLYDPTLVQRYEDKSKEYSEQAMMSEANAKISELNSANSSEKAKASEESAKTSELNAKDSENNAKNYELLAKEYKEQAGVYAEQAREYAEQSSQGGDAQELVNNNIGRLNQLGYYGTLVGDTLTFEKPAEEEEYELKKGFTYLVDLLFEAVGELDDNIKIVIKNGDYNVNIVNVIHDKPSEPITVGEIKQIMKYSTDLGWRWLFNAWYTETQAGDKVLVMPSTVVSGLPMKVLNVSVASGEWMPSTMYAGFGYEVMIHIDGVKSSHTPTVIFGITEATSGNYAPIAIAEDDAVTIFAKEQPSGDIIIPVIVLE